MTDPKSTNKPVEKTAATKAIELIIKDCTLVHNQLKEPYAIVQTNGVRQVHSVTSKGFSQFVASRYYAVKKAPLSDAALKTVISTLAGKALFDGKSVETFTRIAKTEDGYWLDLCNEQWEAVLITKNGWSIKSGNSVPLFQRSLTMKPLPRPEAGGSLDALWKLVNIPPEHQMMIVAWLLECLRNDTPHVVLELVGEQGTAKSTTQKLLKMLIDPSAANLKANPKKVEDVWVGATNCHLVSFENISHLSFEYQDALCVLATGGALSARTLYTNHEETVIELRKPIVLNGISVNVTAQDLSDRSIYIELPPVNQRLQSNAVDKAFDSCYSQLLGALLDQFVAALNHLGSVEIDDADKPRMVDFAYLGEALYQANGYSAGTFVQNYSAMRQQGVYRTIESSPVGVALLYYLDANPNGWTGKLQDLLVLLPKPTGESHWPKSAKGLGDILRRLAPALRTLGYECRRNDKQSGSIIWTIGLTPRKVSLSSPTSPASPKTPDDLGHEGHENHSFAGADIAE